VQVMLGLRSDERTGRSELLLVTPITRARLVLTQVAVAVAAVLLVTAAVGCAVWVTTLAISGTADATLALSGLAHAPAAAVFIAVPALLIALAPRAAVGATWAVLAIAVAIGQFGELLALPDWLRALSPFSHSAAVPVESVEPVDVATLLAIALVGAGLAAVAARRRDLVSG
jgi:ABC-2 type transport system permease protein